MQSGTNALTSVEKMDIYTRRRSVVATAPVRNASFAVDGAGEVRFAHGAASDNVRKLF